jgi:hypothetical protein
VAHMIVVLTSRILGPISVYGKCVPDLDMTC